MTDDEKKRVIDELLDNSDAFDNESIALSAHTILLSDYYINKRDTERIISKLENSPFFPHISDRLGHGAQ